MKTFLEPLQELEEMRLLREALTKNKKIYDVSGCIDVQKAHLIYGIGEGSPFRKSTVSLIRIPCIIRRKICSSTSRISGETP